MVDVPSSGSRDLKPRTTIRAFPTIFGAVLIATVVSAAIFRLSVADPSVVGLVWAGLAGVALVGMVFPLVSARVLRIEVDAAPTDLFVGQLGSVELRLRGRASGLALRCGRSPLFVVDITSPDRVRLPLEVAERGAFDHIPVELTTDAPFSVLMVGESRVVALPRQMLVGPQPIPGTALIGAVRGEEIETSRTGHAVSGDTVRSVRPYVSGDPSHMVHWPSSARLGTLVVREFEPPEREGVAVVVAITGPNGSSPVEEAVSRAAGIALNALDRGARVMLCTNTAQGPVCEEAASALEVQRRLAVAVGGPVPSAPDGWPAQVVGESPGSVGESAGSVGESAGSVDG